MRKTLTILFFSMSLLLKAQEHPNLILTVEDVAAMQSSIGGTPLFDRSYEEAKKLVDEEILLGINVPLPKDLAGGYTHERHRANFLTMQKAGVLFQLTEDEKYAVYIRDILLEYAKLFPTFEKHPQDRSYARGKFFWQCLNDANWLVYTIQAYDNIYDWLDKKIKSKLNAELFRPYAEYISVQNPQFFNRVHNHSTWGNAAVGMVGLVIDDQELVEWSLYGLDAEIPEDRLIDDDGGAIQLENQKDAGFFAQLDHSFTPDGYYTEGPYYQRYAMYPFLIFAQALENEIPDLAIFKYREGLLINAVYVLIDLSNDKGEFFPFNDAQKKMSLSSRELILAISMAYDYGTKDPSLLSLIENQGAVPLNASGLTAAQAIEEGKAKKYKKKSRLLFDGQNGDEGAIAVLRSNKPGDATLVMKYAKHGMGHGHFDQLGFSLYDEGNEVFQDYGAARWVNIKHKDGGGYLKENKTWAKQTVAHNSIVINRTSQYGAKVKLADENHGNHVLFDTLNKQVKVISAENETAYDAWTISRTMAMIQIDELEKPLVLDFVGIASKSEGTGHAAIDIPLYYVGELMSTNVELKKEASLKSLGESFGYQHLWKEAEAVVVGEENFKMTWFNGESFYSLTSATQAGDKILFTRIGANDPNYNLRAEPGLIINRKAENSTFVQAYEMHGTYNYSTEIPDNSFSSVNSLKILDQSKDYYVLEIALKEGVNYGFCLWKGANGNEAHTLTVNGTKLSWEGPYYLYKN